MFTVYVIESNSSKKRYIGQTENLELRLIQHKDPKFDKRSYTKLNGTNWILVYKETFQTRKEAMKREQELKSYRGREFIKQQLGR